MKTSKEIAKLLFDRQEDFEPVIRALHLDIIDFLSWMLEDTKNEYQSYWVMGYLGIDMNRNPRKAGESLHNFITINRSEILEFFNFKFKLP